MKRIITPHKGGRQSRIEARIDAKLKAEFTAALASNGESFGDWLEKAIKKWLKEK